MLHDIEKENDMNYLENILSKIRGVIVGREKANRSGNCSYHLLTSTVEHLILKTRNLFDDITENPLYTKGIFTFTVL